MATTVINLFGGSGLGKSTTAAKLFGEMKDQRYHVELVTEYVKKWAWAQKKPTGFDQFYLAGKQSQSESQLYGKVDYIVTDSPILLSGYYENLHLKRSIVLPAILNFLEYTKENEIQHLNFVLKRHKAFDPRGRYETEDQAKAVDHDMRNWLTSLDIPLIDVDVPDKERVNFILSYLEREKQNVSNPTNT